MLNQIAKWLENRGGGKMKTEKITFLFWFLYIALSYPVWFLTQGNITEFIIINTIGIVDTFILLLINHVMYKKRKKQFKEELSEKEKISIAFRSMFSEGGRK